MEFKDARETRTPTFKGDGVAVWVHKDKNDNQYLNIKILKNPVITAFKNKPKENK